MTNYKPLLVVLVLLVAIGFVGGFFYYNNKDVSQSDGSNNSIENFIVYKNTDYGFNFSLPSSWRGYSIVEEKWTGNSLNNAVAPSGTKILIRNPKWTASAQYEDLPILVFTVEQWNSYLAEDYSISAAPILASELARNSKYVFALPPRWDFNYKLDYQEAQNIFAGKPLKTFDID